MRLRVGRYYRFFDNYNKFWNNKVGKIVRIYGGTAIVIIPDTSVEDSLTLERNTPVVIPDEEVEEITEAEYILDVL